MRGQLQPARRLTRVCWLRFWRGVVLVAVLGALAIPCGAQASPPDTPAAPDSLEALARARDRVQTFFDQFSNVACTEAVTQIVLGQKGRLSYRENSSYDYQFLATSESGMMKVNEFRNTHNPAFRDPGRTLLITNGFASILLVVHPMYEASYTFESAGEESLGGATLAKIHFAPVAGATSPAALRLRGKNYPLPLSGTLWIEPQTGVIVKLEAQVDSSLSELGLAGMQTEVRYAPHTFHDPEETMWIPESAVIDVETPRQHWRNLHHFKDYKRFSVGIHEEIGQSR